MPPLSERLKNTWNAFMGRDPTQSEAYLEPAKIVEQGSYSQPYRVRLTNGNAKNIVSMIYNKIAVDVSQVTFNHVFVDENGDYESTIDDSLNRVLTKSANLDQTAKQLIRDIIISVCDEGCIAVVPVETSSNPYRTDSYKIKSVRVGKILEWFPQHVVVRLYDDRIGLKKDILVKKRLAAIIENPFYYIMNEPNSVAQRLTRVLNDVDRSNSMSANDKMNLIIQLPYLVKTKAKQELAKERLNDVENQLTKSKFGIAYIDGTERVVQLNRPLENNLWTQAIDLTSQLYNQLGLSASIFDGTADAQTLTNYYDRTINPFCSAIADEIERKWLSETAIAQRQAIFYHKDPFELVPMTQMAELADKFTRNEIMTSNEIRSKIGMKPSEDPKANELRNSNISRPEEEENQTPQTNGAEEFQNG